MRLEVLSHIVIKFTIGLFMLAQALYHIVIYSTYTSRLEEYLKSTGVLDNDLFQLIAPLFPFLKFALGLMLTLDVYYKEVMPVVISIFCCTTIIHFFAGTQLSTLLITIVLLLLSIWHYANRKYIDKYKKLSYL